MANELKLYFRISEAVDLNNWVMFWINQDQSSNNAYIRKGMGYKIKQLTVYNFLQKKTPEIIFQFDAQYKGN